MSTKAFGIVAGLGCLVLVVAAAAVVLLYFVPINLGGATTQTVSLQATRTPVPSLVATQEAVATIPAQETPIAGLEVPAHLDFAQMYATLNPGVVNIQVFVQQQGTTGEGGGSGFILDDQGHIITNNHVAAQAELITVIFFNGLEMEAQVVGLDADSDLAVLKVDQLPDGAQPLKLANSDEVQPGQWVVAIGNPFGFGSSMTTGIVSAVGRTIPSGAQNYRIPHAIQTDAAINPGNSGGPLLNLSGEVIGVNAQIATGGQTGTGTGVGFAIPSNIVRMVAPVLIQAGAYEWPYLGVRGAEVGLFIELANNLDFQEAAYIHAVEPNSPAEAAGLQGSTGTTTVLGISGIPVGGDVVITANGQKITSFDDLLTAVAFRNPGDGLTMTVVRNGQQIEVTATLAPRP
jgi:S1-C subfamily serine protease